MSYKPFGSPILKMIAVVYNVCQKYCPFGRRMQRILKAWRDGRFAVIPAKAGIQTGPRIGVRGDGEIQQIGQEFWQLV
jgi:hypothetical protein